MTRRIVGALAVAVLAAAGWGGWRLLAPEPPPLPAPPAVTANAVAALHAVELPDLASRLQKLGQWRGQVLVVNYWATWCAPCREEMPMLSRLAGRYAGRGVQIVGIAADSGDKVREYARATPVAYPLLVGGEAAIEPTVAFGNLPKAVPFTLVIDRQGAVQLAMLGRVDGAALARLLDGLTR